MYKKHAFMTKEVINTIVPKIKEFWATDDAVDFMTKVAYLYNGYYVPTKIDNDLNYNTKCDEPERPSQKELVFNQLLSVFLGCNSPEKALEIIKSDFIDFEYPVAKSEDDE